MDHLASAQQQQPPPRLRLTRQAFANSGGTSTRPNDLNYDNDNGQDDDEDDASTPRRPTLDISHDEPPYTNGRPEVTDTPAARLRALLSRVPNTSTSQPAVPTSPTEFESDYDLPQSSLPNSTAHASTRESLKDLFSRALRAPGDTPVKNRGPGRPRRNSIGSSGVDDSPMKTRVKRTSLSDEEAERISKYQGDGASQHSFRSSQAATFDSLRARLSNVNPLVKSAPPRDRSEILFVSDNLMESDTSADPVSHLRDISLPSGSSTPPAATSTPLRQSHSQFPSHYAGSNLMNEDSDMQRLIRAVGNDTTGDEFLLKQRSMSTPHARTAPSQSSQNFDPSTARSILRSGSANRTSLSRHSSIDSADSASSRASSSQSAVDYHDRGKDQNHDLNRDREKGWNRPISPNVSRHYSGPRPGMHSGRNSPVIMRNGPTQVNGLSRRGSASSLLSDDGHGQRSRTNSIGSQSDYNEQQNVRNSSHAGQSGSSRPLTTLHPSHSTISPPRHSPGEGRARTMSQPTRPSSSLGRLAANSPPTRERSNSSFTHHKPSSSLHLAHHPSSRASSPASSLASQDSTPEVERERQHERERNWGSPRPKWELNTEYSFESDDHPPRHASPVPQTHHHSYRDHHNATKTNGTHERLNGQASGSRSRSHSMEEAREGERASSAHPTSNGKSSSSLRSHASMDSHHQRPASPLPPAATTSNTASPGGSPGSSHRFGWTFPRGKSAIPSLDLHESDRSVSHGQRHQRMPSSPSPTPGSRPNSRASGAAPVSHIPVRARKLSESAVPPESPGAEYRKGHRRTAAEYSKSVGGVPPRISSDSQPVNTRPPEGASSQYDAEYMSRTNVPVTQPFESEFNAGPSMAGSRELTPPPNTPVNDSVDRLQTRITTPLHSSFSPPPSPPPQQSESVVAATPKRPSSFSRSMLEFKTPSPPKGMPDLPGPPSSSEEEDSDRTPVRTPNGDAHANHTANLKTPRPPGAWSTPFTTPALPRANSLPPDDHSPLMREPTPPYTPPASFSRATSLPLQTPAPPGAWTATPSSSKRKALKVRFDDEPPPENGGEETELELADPIARSSRDPLSSSSATNGDAQPQLKSAHDQRSHMPELPPSPPRPPPRTPRRSPGIRLVDAYGKVLTPAQEEVEALPRGGKGSDEVQVPPDESSLRRKNKIRVLDAMGKEMEAEGAEQVNGGGVAEQDSIRLDSKQAKQLLQKTVADLKDGLTEIDQDSDALTLNDPRVTNLDELSHKARAERAKISRQLQLTQRSGGKGKSRNASSSGITKALPSASWRPAARTNTCLFWTMVLVQIVLVITMYRVSQLRARRLFITTYYDPLNPELHIHVTKPELLQLSMDSPLPSIFAHHDGDITSFLLSVWQGLVARLFSSEHALTDSYRDTTGAFS